MRTPGAFPSPQAAGQGRGRTLRGARTRAQATARTAPGRPRSLPGFAIPPQVDAAAVHLRKQGPGAVIFAATVVVGNLDLVFPQLRLIKGLKFLKFLA